MDCPACASQSTRKFNIVYEEGTTKGTSEGSSGHSTEHFSQTPLAKRCSPPDEPSPGFLLGIVGFAISVWFAFKLGAVFGSFWLGAITFFIAFVGLTFFWSRILARKAFVKYHTAYEQWQKSWICTKCGHSFVEGN